MLLVIIRVKFVYMNVGMWMCVKMYKLIESKEWKMDILICNSVYDYICVGLCYKELNMFVYYVYMFIVVFWDVEILCELRFK